MMRNPVWQVRLPVGCLVCLLALTAVGSAQQKDEFAADRDAPASGSQSLPDTVRQALENNPGLAAQRRQRGIAAARVVIAETYPFNPVLETRVQSARGPLAAGVTNRLPVESLLLFEVEVHGQARHRRVGAAAALSRTEWEIAAQEQSLAVQVIRAYGALQYRQEKLRLLDETLRFNEQLVADVRRLVDAGRLRPADLVVARTEVSDTLDLLNAGREAETAARQDLLRLMGVVGGTVLPEGPFEPDPWVPDVAALVELADARRADLRARQLAVVEAAANVRLTASNRYGNPIVGPAVTYDPSKVVAVGAQVNIPVPVANVHRGEVFQSEAEHAQAAALLRQAEVNVRQDVAAGLARLSAAERRADQFRTRVLPDLRQAVGDMEKLFRAGEPGLDLLRVIDVRRKLLRARDGYLDALWSVRQARADVAAAAGEPALGLPQPPVPVTPPARMGVPRP